MMSKSNREILRQHHIQDKNGNMCKITPGKTKVILIERSFKADTFNPVWDSVYGCVGTIMRINTTNSGRKFGPLFSVKWDNNNNFNMLYQYKDLQVYSDVEVSDNPNATFKK